MIISAEILATKLRGPSFAGQVAKHPRRLELLWFLQWASFQPGGLPALSEKILSRYQDRLGTEVMRRQKATNGQWSAESCQAVWQNPPAHGCSEFDRWMEHCALIPTPNVIREGVKKFNRDYFLAVCQNHQRNTLPARLAALCSVQESQFEDAGLYSRNDTFADLYPALFDYMDHHAAMELEKLGKNRVTELVFNRLDFAIEEKYPVIILGDSRIGKTKSVSTWCAMRPGKARLVTLPDTSREWELYTAHADALGLPYNPNTTVRTLKRAVEFAMQNSGMFFVYDEAQMALPQKYDRNTVPRRLNWLRSQVIDKSIGCAFFATRQNYQHDMQRFVSVTQYQMEQWLGRIAPALILPADLDHCDMLSAAKALFPGMDSDLLALIVERCVQKESGFQYLRPIAAYTRFHARQEGRK
ncbi:MAG TPA: hypothetical protein VNX46_02340 [Candidatus Acidoferrum sp.]|nr:hypothetical protein [Candidatus Acidoferrum sp.]